ncbi:hypothetical protein [Streptomyces sp. NPDC006551]|uniref:hypothetical protein n=1 Tax=Streptomyces sp. NPDC006551 TaxID=3157178 RepID=UPI0033BE6179
MPTQAEALSACASEALFRLATLRRFTGRQVRLTVHAAQCPVVPEDGKVVISSGSWQVLDVTGSGVGQVLQAAEESGVSVLASCRRCGGWQQA